MSTKWMLVAQIRRIFCWLKTRLHVSGQRRRGSWRHILLRVARMLLWMGALTSLFLLVPFLLVRGGHQQAEDASYHRERIASEKLKVSLDVEAAQLMVRVYLSDTRTVESVPLEQYVRGVIAAEMPSSFELEALKAQAIVARTYIMRRLLASNIGSLSKGADITNTVAHQVYKPLAKVEQLSKDALAKLNRVIEETRDLIITYEGKPIMAAFFSTSNGYTENAEDYWGNQIPYLKSVASPWDKQVAPRYVNCVEFQINHLLSELGLLEKTVTEHKSFIGNPATKQALNRKIRILSYTDGKRVKKVQVGSKHFTGREIREKLGLRSSSFDWRINGDKLNITTYGFGHGIGMSQYGAQGMAKKGFTAEQIIAYYYKGVKLDKASKRVASLVVANNGQSFFK